VFYRDALGWLQVAELAASQLELEEEEQEEQVSATI